MNWQKSTSTGGKTKASSVDDSVLESWLNKFSVSKLQKGVLRWYEQNARDLPWRKTRDPYKIWISEVMLQQTQVVTVIPYWNRFIESFPTAGDLADTAESEVLKHWEGLGYYRRARQLHAAAKVVKSEFGGKFPTDYQNVLSLPGIGRYTASAVLSISQNQALPILEGNTVRLFSRLLGFREDPTGSRNQKLLWQFSESTVSAEQTGSFNQGLMELGALICRVADPACPDCPLKNLCVAKKESLQTVIPAPKEKKTKYVPVVHFAMALGRNGKFLLRKCQEGEFFQGLWDFPRSDFSSMFLKGQDGKPLDLRRVPKDPEKVLTVASEFSQWCKDQLGLDVQLNSQFHHFRHAVTKYRILLLVFMCEKVKGKLKASAIKDGWKWFTKDELSEIPLSATGRKIFHLLDG